MFFESVIKYFVPKLQVFVFLPKHWIANFFSRNCFYFTEKKIFFFLFTVLIVSFLVFGRRRRGCFLSASRASFLLLYCWHRSFVSGSCSNCFLFWRSRSFWLRFSLRLFFRGFFLLTCLCWRRLISILLRSCIVIIFHLNIIIWFLLFILHHSA